MTKVHLNLGSLNKLDYRNSQAELNLFVSFHYQEDTET